MTHATSSTESIGAALADDAWAKEGRALILRPEIYAKAVATLTKKCGPGVRQAFDRRLARIAADAPIIVRPNLPKPPKPRKKRAWSPKFQSKSQRSTS